MDLDNPSYFSLADGADPSSFSIYKQPHSMGNLSAPIDVPKAPSEIMLKPPKSQENDRGFRNLLRSLSTNSADSNQEMLIMGQPRLSDIAPEFASKKYSEPRRANSLKSNKSEPAKSDIIYSPLATSENTAIASDPSDDEEVFLTEDSAKYYNMTAKAGNTASQRRHSIGTFMGRDRSVSITSSSMSFKEDFPQAILHTTPEGSAVKPIALSIDDHSLRHASYPRKRCNRCPRGPGKRTADMDDILIISVKESAPANLWVEYFMQYFEQTCKNANRKPYKIHHLGIEDVIAVNGDVRFMAEKTSGVKLQLVILCPLLLEKIAENNQATASLSKILLPDRVLALQLGTTDADVTDIHKNALTSFSQWQRRSVGQDQDEGFAHEFIATAMAIFSKIWKIQSSTAIEESSQFSVAPKKIRQGQTSLYIMLEYAVQKEDTVKVMIAKNDEFTEIKSVKRRNPYTLKVSIPEHFLEVSAIVNILVEKNGSVIGKRPVKCESRLRELEQSLRSINKPVEFMCQTLGFSPHDPEQLDNWMVHMFQKNVPPNFNLFVNNSDAYNEANKHNCEEFPTILHFAARYGLEKLTMQLIDCPGGDLACEIRNVHDQAPADIAENAGHKEIAQMLKGYSKVNQFAKMYQQLKHMTTPEASFIEDNAYSAPRKMDDFYKVCPAPKPVPSSITIMEEPPLYLAMNLKPSPTLETLPSPQPLIEPKSKTFHTSLASINSSSSNKSQAKNVPAEDKVQVELAEIMNDFKNNVHTIAQTEQLVADWQNRNDVQKSFKEKQEQLNQMRVKYEQIQKDMKSSTKKASPFDRIKKIFAWRTPKEESLDVGFPQNPQKNEVNLSSQRPISSLSIQSTSSSASSGRMSTISACSLGDSGTHSDQEERKNIINIHSEDEFRNDVTRMGFNYLIPPTPKPVKTGMLFHNKNSAFPTIEERPPVPSPRPEITPDDDIYYIQFPPNGSAIDVHPKDNLLKETDNNDIQYMNLPIQPPPPNRDDNHEYMNFKVK